MPQLEAVGKVVVSFREKNADAKLLATYNANVRVPTCSGVAAAASLDTHCCAML